MDNLRVVTLDEIPAVLRWIDLSHRAGSMTGESALTWRLRVVAWKRWLELPEDLVQ